MPTTRNARGVDIIAYSRDASRFVGVQVKALSKRNPVPLGTSLDKIMGDFWVIVNRVASPSPAAFILLPSEVRERAHRGEKDGRVSHWLQPGNYEQEAFREAWKRIGHGGLTPFRLPVTPA
jgi:S1-C subfamily serine protease